MTMRATAAPLLLVAPDPLLAEVWGQGLRLSGFQVQCVAGGEAALEAARIDTFAVVVLDLDLPTHDGLDVLTALRAMPSPSSGHVPDVVVVTAHGSVNGAVEAMRLGAYDFLLKPVLPEKLVVSARNAREKGELATTLAAYHRAADTRGTFHGFIGSSPLMQATYRTVESAAASKATVFVTGESGTGKEVCAHAIHALSARAKAPLVALNCAAIPKDLIESEVFGHVRGAFTGATADRDGAARRAEGGTLFLDEICEMDLSLQSKLLRFVQTGTFTRVGSSKPESVDVRLICATNRDPLAEVDAGRFREDLYYRLHVIPVALPPLREREEDVLDIARDFLATCAREEKKGFTSFSADVERMFLNYDWPGNVRQLHNIIRNIVVLHDGVDVTPAMVPPPVGGRWARPQGFGAVGAMGAMAPLSSTPSSLSPCSSPPPSSIAQRPAAPLPPIRPLAEVEREAIEQAITLCGGNIPRAAALLGVNPSTVYRKKQAWG